MRLRRYLLGGLISAIIIASIIYANFDKVVIFAISKLYSQDISYKRVTKDPRTGLSFDGLRVINRKLGMGFFSQRAIIKPSWGRTWLKSVLLDFKFKDVHFLKTGAIESKKNYDTITQLVAMPFEGRWMYKEVSGLVEIFSNCISIKRFSADGKDIRISITGDIYYDNTVDTEITAYFSKDVLKEVPQELHSVIMQNEPNEWKSFSVKVKGNLTSPAIQITGKMFRLNFGMVKVNE